MKKQFESTKEKLNFHFTPKLRKDVFKTRLSKKKQQKTKQGTTEFVDENDDKFFRDSFNLVI
jgi:hypothetical protein